MATVQSPTEFISTKTPPIVWVTTTDNTVVPITQPHVRGDSLAGLAEGQDPITVPLSSVQSVRARQPAPGKTRLLVLGSLVVAAGMAATLVGVGRAQGIRCVTPRPERVVVPERRFARRKSCCVAASQ